MNSREVWPDLALLADEVAPYVLTAPAMRGQAHR